MKQGLGRRVSILCLTLQVVTSSQYDRYDGAWISNIVTYGNAIVTMTTRSKVTCVAKCSEISDCRSVVFLTSSNLCTLNGEVTDVTAMTCAYNTGCSTYYAEKGSASTMRSSCQNDDECTDDNSECRGNQCQCLPGYSYDATNLACVSSCTSYGTTFQEDVGNIMQGSAFNMGTAKYLSTSLEDCRVHCLNAGFICKTFEYDFSSSTCYLQDYTMLEEPAWYRAVPNYIMYTRDCA